MKVALALSMVLVGCGVAFSSSGEVVLHVSPRGDDGWSGEESAPLATPQGAAKRLRQLRAAGEAKGSVSIVFAAGRYVLSEPWTLTGDDGGTESAPVVWRAATAGGVVFSGAATLDGWKRVTDSAVLDKLPAVARGEVYEARIPGVESLGDFSGGWRTKDTPDNDPVQLFEAEERLSWARWPDEGYTKVQDILGEVRTGPRRR